MSERKVNSSKLRELELSGTFNKKYQRTCDELFQDHDFFDPHDMVQVKYEMLRRVRQDNWPVTKAAETYGLSRFAYYEAETHFKELGLFGLLPKKKGPRRSHKLTADILTFVGELEKQKSHSPEELAGIIEQNFAVEVHPRSIRRAMDLWKKKR